MKRELLLGVMLVCLALPAEAFAQAADTFAVGWIGPLTGSAAKLAVGEAARVAQDDVNAAGGIRGKPLRLIMEDSRGQGQTALSAFQKLVAVDHVKFIIGGHSTPESSAIAPLADKRGVLVLAAVTSSPKLTGINPNFFRISGVSAAGGGVVAEYALVRLRAGKAAIITEETDYVLPVAAKFKEVFKSGGGSLVYEGSFQPGESDFRAMVAKLKAAAPDIIYVGVQSPDAARLILKQLSDMGVKAQLIGNEQFGLTALVHPDSAALLAGTIYPDVDFDDTSSSAKELLAKLKERYQFDTFPTGVYTVEGYDAVRLLAKLLNDCGTEVAEVKQCLSKVRDYQGVSGPLSISPERDGIRKLVLKRVQADGKGVVIK